MKTRFELAPLRPVLQDLVLRRINTLVENKDETIILALTRERQIAGTVALRHLARRAACVRQLYVDCGVRRCGIGTQLIQECIAIAEKSGCLTLSLGVAKCNEQVLPFYTRLGFVIVHEWDDGEIILAKTLRRALAGRNGGSES